MEYSVWWVDRTVRVVVTAEKKFPEFVYFFLAIDEKIVLADFILESASKSPKIYTYFSLNSAKSFFKIHVVSEYGKIYYQGFYMFKILLVDKYKFSNIAWSKFVG